MILNRQRTVRVARPPLESFLHRVREQLGLNGAEVTICLVSDAQIARMNQSFRKKEGPTDVLSFPAENSAIAAADRGGHFSRKRQVNRASVGMAHSYVSREGTASAVPQPANKKRALAPEAIFLGDIAISPATARRNAKKFRRTLPNELQILILHGVLHLLGYDHETDRGQMTRVENKLRRKLGLA